MCKGILLEKSTMTWGEVNTVAQIIQNNAFQRKFINNGNESYNPFHLITPIIFKGEAGKRVKRAVKINTGPDLSCIDQQVFQNKQYVVSSNVNSANGTLLFLNNKVI